MLYRAKYWELLGFLFMGKYERSWIIFMCKSTKVNIISIK